MRKQPVFKSSLGTELRVTSVKWDAKREELIARGIGYPQNERNWIEMRYLLGEPYINLRGQKVTWKYDRTERRR